MWEKQVIYKNTKFDNGKKLEVVQIMKIGRAKR